MSNIKVIGTNTELFDTSLRAEVYIQDESKQIFKLEISRLDIQEVYHFVMGKGKDALRGISFELALKANPQYKVDAMADLIVDGKTMIPLCHVNPKTTYIVIDFMYHSYGLDGCKIKCKNGVYSLSFRNVVEIASASSSSFSSSYSRMKRSDDDIMSYRDIPF